MWKRCCVAVGLASTFLFFAPAVVLAQSIGGTVTDSTGAVLPGVTVEVRSPALIEQVRTAVSDGVGQYLITSLVAGTYTVTFGLSGFSALVREGIQLTGTATATVDAQLRVGSVGETITVSGAAPVVDIQNVRQQAVMSRDVVDTIPTGRYFNNLGVLVPGMVTGTTYGVGQDVGGQSGQSHQRMSIHGGAQTGQRIMVDGMSMSPWTQEDAALVWLADGNFEEVQIDYSASSAEVETGGVRFNLIPRAGGNTFSSRNFFNFSAQGLQTDNVNQALIDAGLPEPNRLKELWHVNPSIGGPIMRNRLWFFGAYTRQVADSFVAFYEDVDPNAPRYTANLSQQAFDDQNVHDAAVRLTWQATAKNKFQFYFDHNYNCHCHFLIGTALAVNVMPSASTLLEGDTQTYQATWTSTLSNRLLFEAGVSALPQFEDFGPQPEVNADLPGILEIGSGRIAHRGMAAWYPPGRRNWLIYDDNTNVRASLSYVTGSHSAKFGTTFQVGNSARSQDGHLFHSQQLNNFGSPVAAQFSIFPLKSEGPWDTNYMRAIGVYGQDQWTLDRLTINAGARFDYFRGGYPDHTLPRTTWGPGASFPGQDVATWKDLSPRLGLAYDLRGDGKTALKVTANRYVAGYGTTLAGGINPALQNVGSGYRTWLDGAFGLCIPPVSCIPGDGIPQGDPRNPVANGELIGAAPNRAFGTPTITSFVDPEWAFGWGSRLADWEFSGGVQHELIAGVSLNASYFRRLYSNFSAVDNRLHNPEDFDPFCVTVPTHAGLPNSGQPMCGLYEVKQAKFGIADQFTTAAENFGKRTQHWNGGDFTVNARMANGVLLQGGVSTGRGTQDQCEVNANLNNPAGDADIRTSALHCATQEPFLTQVKFLGAYTLPYGIQIAGTFQSLPGQEILANVTYTAAEISAALGRPSTTSTTTIQVIEPTTEYSDRLNQFDLRLTKMFTLGRSRLRAMFDTYNIFNGSTALKLNNQYGAAVGGGADWLRPQLVVPGRLLKFAFQLDF